MGNLTLKSEFNKLVDKLLVLYSENEAKSIAYLLIERLLNYSKIKYHENRDKKFPNAKLQAWNSAVDELLLGKPIQQVVEYSEFYGLSFFINKNVLIPRPETEELVDLIIKENSNKKLDVLDIGTGSGCIPIALKHKRALWEVMSIDISSDAIIVAKKNAESNNVKVNFVQANIIKTEKFENDKKFDIIVSNPPYIPLSEKEKMHVNVLNFEPELALFVPDETPLIFYKVISDFAIHNLKPGGKLYFEVHENYAKDVNDFVKSIGFKETEIILDCNNKQRIVKALL